MRVDELLETSEWDNEPDSVKWRINQCLKILHQLERSVDQFRKTDSALWYAFSNRLIPKMRYDLRRFGKTKSGPMTDLAHVNEDVFEFYSAIHRAPSNMRTWWLPFEDQIHTNLVALHKLVQQMDQRPLSLSQTP